MGNPRYAVPFRGINVPLQITIAVVVLVELSKMNISCKE